MPVQGNKVVACIVARMNSRRLPQKALANVDGKPLLQRLVERIQCAASVDEVVICTSSHPDDAILLEKAEAWGAGAFAGDEDNVLSRLIAVGERCQADLVLRVTGDNVLTCPEAIDGMVPHHLEHHAEYTRTNGLPLGVTAEVMTVGMLDRLARLMPDPNQSQYLMLYAFDPGHFRCEVLEAAPDVYRPHYSLSVDTRENLALADRMYRECPAGPGGPRTRDVIALLDADPDTYRVPDDAPVRMPGGATMTYRALLDMMDERAATARAQRREAISE